MFRISIFSFVAISTLFSCGRSAKTGPNKFSDPIVRKIYDLKDRRLSDSLYVYFHDENVEYRQEAALAFASIQDSTAIEKLGKWFLQEQDSTVRRSIALAIGQTQSQHCERIILGALMREKDPGTMKELLEAYGKTTAHWQLVQPAFLHDTVKAEGLAWSIYRAGLRNATDSSANRVASVLATEEHHERTQLGAVNFFARGAKNFETAFNTISTLAKTHSSPDVRMAAAFALGKITTEESQRTIEEILKNDKDERVRINAVRALQNFPFDKTKGILFNALYDKRVNLAIASSEVIKSVAKADNWIELSNVSTRVQNWRVQANLYEAALHYTENKSLIEEVKALYKQSVNPYQKAALLTALKNCPVTYDFVEGELNADIPVIKSSAAASLSDMNYSPKFNKALKERFAATCKRVMPAGDLAVIGTFASTLGDSTLNYRSIVKDFAFLSEAKQKLSLPKDNEALQPVDQAIAYFEKRKPVPVKNEFNHPIDWEAVQKINASQKVLIKTSKGKIKLQLFVEEAPGSVSNFLKLAQDNYFDKKVFHRVVPNFVIQGGCNRGDGWGGEDYSIRSEFSHRRYTTGSVGMASAGKDTEGTQWFITHSPTPHLDGRYTIFAEVIDGMPVVDLIEVGDQIIDVEILKD